MTFTDMDFDKHRLAPLEVAVKMYTPCYWSKRLYCAASCNENVKINFKIYADRHLHTTERQGISREAHKKHWIIIKKNFSIKVSSRPHACYTYSHYTKLFAFCLNAFELKASILVSCVTAAAAAVAVIIIILSRFFCFHLFHTLALFAKDIYTILCIIEKRCFSSIFFDPFATIGI